MLVEQSNDWASQVDVFAELQASETKAKAIQQRKTSLTHHDVGGYQYAYHVSVQHRVKQTFRGLCCRL